MTLRGLLLRSKWLLVLSIFSMLILLVSVSILASPGASAETVQGTAYLDYEGDIAAPDAPTGLTAIAGYASLSLNWTAPLFNGGGAIDYYVVYLYDIEMPDHPTGLTMNVTGLDVSDIYSPRTYIFTVAAHNAAGTGPQSDYADATPYSLPGGIRHWTFSSGNEYVNLSWLFPESDGGSAVLYYVIYQDGVDVLHTIEGRVTISGLTNGQEYNFSIAAHNAAGDGPQRGETLIPMTYPDAPTDLTVIPGNGQVSLSWSAPNDGGSSIWSYVVVMDGNMVYGTTDTSAVITGLTNGQTYVFAVYAQNLVGDGPTTLEVLSTPSTVPGAPTGLKAVPGINQAYLSWTAPIRDGGSAIDYYVIYQDGVQLPDHVAGKEVVITGLNKSIWDDDQKYTFTVAAHNAFGDGPQSKPVGVIPIAIPPEPRRVESTPGDGEITISWMSPDQYSGSPILYYIVFKDGVDAVHTSDYSVTFKGLTNGQTYLFSVASHNDAGNSTHWNLTDYPRTTPDAPTDLAATPGNGQVSLSWSAPIDNGGAKIWSYIIFMDGAMEAGTQDTSIVIDGLKNGITYNFTVLAQNLVGEGPRSSGVISTPRPDVPTVPVDLTAIPGDGRIELSWSSPLNNGGAQIDYYAVYQDGNDVEHVSVNSVTIIVRNGESHSFTVAAHNAAGTSAYSNAVQETPYTFPDAPIGFTTVPGNGQVTLNWNAPAFDGGRAIDYYIVYQDRIALPYHLTGPTTIIAGLDNGHAYSFTVSAHNLAGIGTQSHTMESTPGTLPDAPTGLEAVPDKVNITLNWTAPMFDGGGIITGYNIYRSTTEAGTYSIISTPSGLSYVDVDVFQGQTYWYKVRSVNTAGESAQVGPVSVILPKAPSAPQDLQANTSNAQVTLTWIAPNDHGGSSIDYYAVFQNNIDIMHVTGNSVMITGLTNGQSYSFTIAAHNFGGLSAYSNIVQTRPYTLPNAPVGLTATPGNRLVTLTWDAGDDGGSAIVHYDVTQNGAALSIDPIGPTCVITGLTNGRSYNFTVAGHNSAGIGPYSYVTVSPIQTEPSAPMNLTASTIDSGIVLEWSSPANNGGYPITYMVFRGTAPGSESPLVNIPENSYSDREVVLGISYYYFVKAINQLGSSIPSNGIGPISASAVAVLEMETDTSSSSIGISITITGEVKTVGFGMPIAGVNVDLSYSVNDGLTWIDMTSVSTSAMGSFSTQWIPSATGVYSLRGSWAGNTVYQAAISIISLAVEASSDNHAFTVQSNSTISDLSFNSQNMELSFKVSGDPGTFGYSRIVISKELVAIGSDIKVSLDGTDMDYQLTSTDSSWILYFTYHHSTHSIVASLNEGSNGGSGEVTNESPLLLIAIAGTAVVAILLVSGLVVARKRRNK